MTVRAQIEDAVVTLIGDGLDYLAACRPYNGEIHRGKEDDIRNILLGQLPAVLVATADAKFHEVDTRRRRAVKTMAIELFLVSGNMRDREERTRGESEIYQIAEDIQGLLIGADLGLDGVQVVSPSQERVLVQDADLCVWNVQYEVDVVVERAVPATTKATQVRTSISFPKDEAVIASGIGDSLALALGLVTLTDAGATFPVGYVGARIVIAGATSPANNGTFDIVAAGAHQVRWANANGVTEAFTGTWSVIPAPMVVLDTDLS